MFTGMIKKNRRTPVVVIDGCQLPCIQKFSVIASNHPSLSTYAAFKRFMAVPWNYYVKNWLKKIYYHSVRFRGVSSQQSSVKALIPENSLKEGDKVRVRIKEEIINTLDPFGELKGCSFLPDMFQYCGTEQHVFKTMQYFLDERDYKRKKTRGLILLENIFCNGTPVFGPCDRSCFLFWREEWLEKVEKI